MEWLQGSERGNEVDIAQVRDFYKVFYLSHFAGANVVGTPRFTRVKYFYSPLSTPDVWFSIFSALGLYGLY